MQRSGDVTGGDQKQVNYQESRKLSIQRCIINMEHACQCRDADCRFPGCQRMNVVASHAKTCKRRFGCALCKQVVALNYYHAKDCQDTKCPVPFCLNIKYKLKDSGKTDAVKETSPASSNLSPPMMLDEVPHDEMCLKMGAMDMSDAAGPVVSDGNYAGLPQDTSANPGTSAGTPVPQQRSEAQVLERLLTSLKSSNSSQQKQQVVAVFKSNPHLLAGFIKRRILQQAKLNKLKDERKE